MTEPTHEHRWGAWVPDRGGWRRYCVDEDGAFDHAADPFGDDLAAQLADIEEPTVVDVQAMSPDELLERYSTVRTLLYHMGELRTPTSREARDLHSERVALALEIRRRREPV